ncbi:Succinate--hydroxymethylglutarate CoA-transferase [Apiospora phragmitis]|uniref:Succinate--hydroxymethylglutarate CoA-transferase n=1 Tax=Apiospora phragmitis TaxID=2905665 RepID=A0ABR1WWG9_9PEZI
MTEDSRVPNVYGPGTHTDKTFVPVPQDTERIFRLLASEMPGFTQDEALLSKVQFTGEDFPVIPGPIKAVSVAASLHAMAGVMADEILTLRGAADKDRRITVNTTQAAFWLGTIAAAHVGGDDVVSLVKQGKSKSLIPDWERGWTDTPLKYRATALYPTANPEVWYSLHGSMDAPPVLKSIGVDPNDAAANASNEAAAEHIAQHTRKISPESLEMTNLLNGLCGSICFTPEQWNNSAMGKSLAAHPLVNVKPLSPQTPIGPVAFPPLDPNDKRPLAGVRVLEMTRVIAGPQISTILSSLGADVIRVNPPHLPDINVLQLTLNAGKRTIGLDLRRAEDAATLQALLKDADVFVQGFRLGKMKKYGLAQDEVAAMAAARGRGIVYVSENCYGPDGYYAERPGWQQIADAASGSAYVTGRSLNLPNNEAVLPSLPISDMTCGLLGAVGTLKALRDRAIHGGSYAVHSSLVAVDTYALRPEVGLYPREIVKECADRFQWAEMRGAHHVLDLLVTVWDGWKRVLGSYLEEGSGWFQTFDKSEFGGQSLSLLKPVVSFSDKASTPEWKTPSLPYAAQKATEVKWR